MVDLPVRTSDRGTAASLLEPLAAAYLRAHPGAPSELIQRAGRAAIAAHEGQRRRSGEPYVTHPIAVATIVAELGADETAVAAALLHDAVEDTGLTLRALTDEFGGTVARVVDGVTKLDAFHFGSKEEQEAATVRKMFIAMAQDWRVLLIKLADRLHNMRTLAAMPRANQAATATETREIYAPLANRLGVQQLKWQLDDLAFAVLEPKQYAEMEQLVAARTPEREVYVTRVVDELRQVLADHDLVAEVRGRPKHLWSIYEKMTISHKEFDEIFDLVGLRVIVDTEAQCWHALGVLHGLWAPVDNRLKDYINRPKHNLYQSLHTTVIGPGGKLVEVQIRTQEMHRVAEYGVAAHWGYKEGASAKDLAWVQRLTDAHQENDDPVAFLEALKLDLVRDEVYVLTPKSRVIPLVAGATPIDFAYAVHTEVGHHCVGAKVNGRLVPLSTELKSGDVVEIATKAESGPSRDWLNVAVSSRARSKIRQWFQRERREDAIENGREELIRALRRAGLPIQTTMGSVALAAVVDDLNFDDLDSLLAAIGEGQVAASTIVQKTDRELRGGEAERLPATVAKLPRLPRDGSRAGIFVEGLDDVMVTLARCCTPVPGDPITGFVTQGRGVSVHRTDCANAVSLAAEKGDRIIDVEWDGLPRGLYRATLEILAFDRSRLLFDISSVIAEYHLNIVSSHSITSSSRTVRMTFDVELGDPAHLASLLVAIKSVDGVFDAYRQLPGQKPPA